MQTTITYSNDVSSWPHSPRLDDQLILSVFSLYTGLHASVSSENWVISLPPNNSTGKLKVIPS